MNYPFWEVPVIGGGLVIGIIAILHVFVSHFAVGGGLFLPLTERKAYREKDPLLLAYVRSHSKFFILLTLVFGAVSGVGIWWSIGLVNPAATGTLIHVFVWGWAIEWVFFTVEIAAAFVYYYGWDRLDRKTHLIVGWIYCGAAWMSLVVINGILTFMLTPGRWLETHTFWSAYFNPGMLPSCLTRTAVAVALAGVYALVTASALQDSHFRQKVIRYAAKWLLLGAFVIPLGGVWYMSTLPQMAREMTMGSAPAVTIFTALAVFFSLVVAVFTYFGPYLNARYFNLTFAFLIAILALVTTGVTEWAREAVRKPFIIYNYMYANTLRVDELNLVREQGILKSAMWVHRHELDPLNPAASGADIFRVECASCHTIDGYNSIRFAVKGWRLTMLDYQLQHLNELKGFMPPFVGSPEERQALALWLTHLNLEPVRPPDSPMPEEKAGASPTQPLGEQRP